MPARTYEEHKADVDAAMPTPVPVWRLYVDDPTHQEDHRSVARCEFSFNGVDYVREILAWTTITYDVGEELLWLVSAHIPFDDEARTSLGGGSRWQDASEALTRELEAFCEKTRVAAAFHALARDILVNNGITYGVVNLETLSVDGTAQADVPLSPAFASDTFVYAASTEFTNVALRAAASEGATITWSAKGASIEGPLLSLDLDVGATVITARVSRDEHTATTYRITITRSAS